MLYTPLRMRLCAITDRKRLAMPSEGEAAIRRRLRGLAAGWIEGGVDFIQLREKDLDAAALRSLAEEILPGFLSGAPPGSLPVADGRRSKLFINCPALPASLRMLAPVADGVHLPGRPRPGEAELVRQAFRAHGRQTMVSMACHSLEDVRAARDEGADFVLFAPVFQKPVVGGSPEPGQGLDALGLACRAAQGIPVLALGGVTLANASECLAVGAAGVAGIRLFAGEGWRGLVERG